MTIELKVYAVVKTIGGNKNSAEVVSLFLTEEQAEECAVTKTNDIHFYVVVPCVLLDEEFAKWKEEELEKAREECDDYFAFL